MASEPLASDEPPPSPSRRRTTATSPQGLFKEPDPSAVPLPPPTSLSESPSFGSDSEPDEAPQATPRATSSTLSATDKKALVKAFEGVAEMGGRALHGLVATDVEQSFDLYLLDEEDAEGIAKPTASLLHRRGVIQGGPDVADLIALFIALAAYFTKQFERRRSARAYLESIAGTTPAEPTEAAA